MSLFPAGWRLTTVLLLGTAVLGALLVEQWRERSRAEGAAIPGEGVRTAPIQAPERLSSGYSPPALATFDEILTRPLFAPERRRAEAPEPPAPSASPPVQLRVRLEGVARVGDSSVAVLRDLSTNEGLRLSKGMQYKGWTVEAVEPQRALLKRGDSQVHELKLERQK
jgi:hypothetical protein